MTGRVFLPVSTIGILVVSRTGSSRLFSLHILPSLLKAEFALRVRVLISFTQLSVLVVELQISKYFDAFHYMVAH